MMECILCNGTGIYKKPTNQKEYEKIWEKYDDMGVFTMHECREKALDETGFEKVVCPDCNGTGKKDQERAPGRVLFLWRIL